MFVNRIFLLSFIYLFSCISVFAEDAPIPAEVELPMDNEVKAYLDVFFQPSRLREQLYAEDSIDSGTRQLTRFTREQLETGTVAMIRYGSKKVQEGCFPMPNWEPEVLRNRMKDFIDESLWEADLHPLDMAESVVAEKREEIEKVIQSARSNLDCSHQKDLQAEEVEGIRIVNDTNFRAMLEKIQDRFSDTVPEHFLYQHILTHDELMARGLNLKPNEQFIFTRFKIGFIQIYYTAFQQTSRHFIEVNLNTPKGIKKQALPQIIVAWRSDDRFLDDDQFGQKNVQVQDGYFQIEPYIAKDAEGHEWVDEKRILVIYHTYTRVDPLYVCIEGISDLFRTAECRSFVEKMLSIFGRDHAKL